MRIFAAATRSSLPWHPETPWEHRRGCRPGRHQNPPVSKAKHRGPKAERSAALEQNLGRHIKLGCWHGRSAEVGIGSSLSEHLCVLETGHAAVATRCARHAWSHPSRRGLRGRLAGFESPNKRSGSFPPSRAPSGALGVADARK